MSEGCTFEIELKTATIGEFTCSNVEKLKSINDLQHFVQHTGSCMLEDARNMEIKEKGRCEKTDDGIWKVTKKLNINISK